MGTRSTIGIKKDGIYLFIYCHWDGYYEHNGKILLEHYQDEDKIKKLIELGDLSSLGEKIGTKHDFRDNPRDECNAYIRDRGEEDNDNLYDSVEEGFVDDYLKNLWDREFLYVYDFERKEWLANNHSRIKTLKPLKEIMANLEEEE